MVNAGDVGEEVAKATLPSWVYALRPLVGVASTLATVGSNPEQWVKEVVAGWVVGGVLDALQYVVGWILYGFGVIRQEILQAAGPLAAPYVLLERALVGGIETTYAVPRGVAEMAGLAGPPAAAFSVALTSAFLAVTAYALYYAVVNFVPGGGALEGVEENLRR